jgi:hypothetical protein
MHQTEPRNEIAGRRKLVLPTGTDARLLDKIVHLQTGLTYTAEMPDSIRGHHVAVTVTRTDEQKTVGDLL